METENKNTSKDYRYSHDANAIYSTETIRTAYLSILLIIFGATKMSYVVSRIDYWATKNQNCRPLCLWVLCVDVCDEIQQMFIAYCLILSGLSLMILFSLAAMYKVFSSKRNEQQSTCGLIIMVGLLLAGLSYMCGYWVIIDALIVFKRTTIQNWLITIGFFEYYLGGVAAIVVGVDCWDRGMESANYRIFAFLKHLTLVSFVCFIGWTYIAVKQTDLVGDFRVDSLWKTRLHASGYGLIVISCIMHVLFRCMQCRNILVDIIAILLTIGGIVTAVGYWTLFNETDPYNSSLNSWNSGYSLLVIGLCAFTSFNIWNNKQNTYDVVPKQDD
eukprot:108535_1